MRFLMATPPYNINNKRYNIIREAVGQLREAMATWWKLARLAREIRSIHHQSQAIRREVLAAWGREVTLGDPKKEIQ